jgi:glycosyltransferase involved in cell wall biosynthesis
MAERRPDEAAHGRRLRIGLDLVYLEHDSGGSGTYARELVAAIHRIEPGTTITAWVGRGAPDDIDELTEWRTTEIVRLPVRSTGSMVHLPIELFGLAAAARRRHLDVVHGLAYAAPIVGPVPTVVSILDLTWLHVPKAAPAVARWMFRGLTYVGSRRCDRVIAISADARRDLVRHIGIHPAKVSVTPLGVRGPAAPGTPEAELRDRFGIVGRGPVVLAVGQVAPHKNLLRLVDALGALEDLSPSLVVAGRPTGHGGELRQRADERHVQLHLPGFVSDDELEGLYAMADLLVLPSIAEGFGLPVLEAMVRGIPVACADIGALREVAGGAAEHFDPQDTSDIARACRRLVLDPQRRRELVALGGHRAAALTWDETARATLGAYREAIAWRARRRRR